MLFCYKSQENLRGYNFVFGRTLSLDFSINNFFNYFIAQLPGIFGNHLRTLLFIMCMNVLACMATCFYHLSSFVFDEKCLEY